MKVRSIYTGSGWMLVQDVPCDAKIVGYGLTNKGVHEAQFAFNNAAPDCSTIEEARSTFARLDAEAGGFERMYVRASNEIQHTMRRVC